MKQIKKDFPILNKKFDGKPLIYLDSAATTQKPKIVIDTIKKYYEGMNANIHRGIYKLSEMATAAYEESRMSVKKFLNAKSEKEIIFVRNATEAINMVAYTWAENNIKEGDEIIISALEHHSNYVTWQQFAKKKNAKIFVIPLKNNDYTLNMDEFKKTISKKTKLVAITAMSNVLGVMPDIKKIIKEAHKVNACVLVDGAQSAAHQKTDVQKMDCDFFVMSSHKMMGPTGVGVLYGKEKILESMPPFLYGGDMVQEVSSKKTTFAELPWKFEAGTPNIADVIAFKSALEYLEKIGLDNIKKHDQDLLEYAIKKFSKYKEVKLFVPKNKKERSSVLSFTIQNAHPHDIAQIFSDEGIAIRSGKHCAHPLIECLNVPATARISFYIYNTKEDVDAAEKTIKKIVNLFKF